MTEMRNQKQLLSELVELVELVGELALDLLMFLAEGAELRLVLHLKLFDLALQLLQLAFAFPIHLHLCAQSHQNLAIANRSRISCAHKVTTLNFKQDPYLPLHLKCVAALPCKILNIKNNKTLKSLQRSLKVIGNVTVR